MKSAGGEMMDIAPPVSMLGRSKQSLRRRSQLPSAYAPSKRPMTSVETETGGRRRRRCRSAVSGRGIYGSSLVLAVVALILSGTCRPNRALAAVEGDGKTEGRTCAADETKDDGRCSPGSATSSSSKSPPAAKVFNPPNCRLFLAESSLGPESGLGMFVARPVPRGGPVAPADVVIQIVDIPPTAAGMKLLLHDYLWHGQETGGQFEGKAVFSAIPGVGMLANGHRDLHNVLPYRAEVDEADLPRTTSPGSGAITHYHNYTYFARRDLPAGAEVLINMGVGWFGEREEQGKILPAAPADKAEDFGRDVGWLRENGMCLDSLRAGRSKIKDAGRGAFAARYLPEGSVVAPVPLVPIADGRDALKIVRIKSGKGGKDEVEETRQLLTNYCYGHANSSLLLFPYSPVVNLLNHGGKRANARLRWSASAQHRGRDWPSALSLPELLAKESTGLMLELVATRDIRPGEEVLIDYGPRWQSAWNAHVESWKPPPGAAQYTPSYVMDDVAGRVRTEEEQREFPYGDHVITACFYRYSDNKAEAEKFDAGMTSSSSSSRTETTAFRWKLSRGVFDHSNLRPCSILQREEVKLGPDRTEHLYTVLVRNRYGLVPEERIPRGMTHVVNGVPRHAIRFADKLYTTDQHLPGAFRAEIELPEGVFPERWMDLA